MNDRLTQFLAAENISQAQFADSINVARAGVSHIIAGRNKPSWDFILSTMKRYPTLNIEWLISGKGKMYKNGTSNEGNGVVNENNSVVNEGNGVKMEQDGLFGGDNLFGGTEGRNNGETFDTKPVELGEPVTQPSEQYNGPTSQQVNQPLQQSATAFPANHSYATPQPVPQSMNQPAPVYMTPQNTPQTIVKKPNVAKIIVFFDDGTFQECK